MNKILKSQEWFWLAHAIGKASVCSGEKLGNELLEIFNALHEKMLEE